ncbi:MAG: sulfite exporter TauE/SafE family protein [Endomicrobiaceae bacterium]|nr:sulfite exporter TauE/SafE family protein [Endomicrobiaceae bacterium]
MDTYLFFILPLIGFVGMFSGGYWGVGCGWLIVPTMLIFGFTPNEAVGVGLLQIVPSILPSIKKDVSSLDWHKGSVAVKLVIPLAVGVFLLAFSGKYINKFFYVRFGSLPLLMIFCVFMIFLALIVLFGKANEYENNIPTVTNKHSTIAFFIGAVTGVFSSVLGIGGALFFRPVLINFFKIPENITSKAVRILLLVATFTGGMFYTFSDGKPNYKILGLSLVIAAGGIIGFPLGIRVHNIIVNNGYSKYINKSFAVVTFIVLTNTVLNIFGYITFSRYLMIIIAVLLFVSINLFKIYTNRHKI